ncbi:MAG: FtsQ-type POTRA domain-containing protein [Clostridia bacterium]|nr:FtsQ-type POTRA domain-containing protein [Clostridia bacterium]
MAIIHKKHSEEAEKKRQMKEREKRIQQKNREKKSIDDDFDTVINMTNRNNKKVVTQHKKQQEQYNKKVQKKKKRNKRIIKWTSIGVLVIGGFIFAVCSPIFNIKNITTVNNNILSQETIISLSGLKTEQNIFRFLKSDVEKNIKENPYVESVKINRKLPDTVEIDITERQRNFSVKFLNGYAYINNQGYILEISEENGGLPVIQGTETEEENIVPGKRLNVKDLKKLETAIKIMKIAQENEIADKITGFDISNKEEYIVYFEGEKKTAYLGDGSNLNTKMLYVKEIMEKYEAGKEGSIFVNGDFNNKFKAYFREKV